jgi:hypothetical protein
MYKRRLPFFLFFAIKKSALNIKVPAIGTEKEEEEEEGEEANGDELMPDLDIGDDDASAPQPRDFNAYRLEMLREDTAKRQRESAADAGSDGDDSDAPAEKKPRIE